MDLDALGDTIRELREIRGWDQVDLANRAGTGRSTIGEYERKRCYPELKNLAKIAQAFDAKPSDLLKDAGL